MEQACLMNEDVSDKSTRTSCYLCWNHCWLQYYMLLSLSCFCFYSSLLFHFSFVWKWHNVKQKERERNKMKHIMPIYNYIYHYVCKLLLILSNSPNLKNNWEVEGRNLHFIVVNNLKKKTIFELHLWMIQLPQCCIYKVERLVCGFSVADS